jgi:endonuclease VIII
VLRRLRQDDPTRGVGDALLDQRNLAGVGNVWKSEGCFRAGLDPWRPLGKVADEEALAVVREIRRRMQDSVERGGHPRGLQVYERAGRPCPRCGAPIRARGQGEDNRTTYWCAACQA